MATNLLCSCLCLLIMIFNILSQHDVPDYYITLNVSKDASPRDIKKSFRRLARRLYNRIQTPKDQQIMANITRAYDVLSNKHKRRIYDQYGEEGVKQYEIDHMNNMGRGSGGGIFDMFFGGNTKPKMPIKSRNNVGYSVGGAKDINNFRQNIQNNLLPLKSSITYEGIYYDYYFDTGLKGNDKQVCQELLCPTYSSAVVKNISNNMLFEYYLSVGLNSGIKQNDFKRKNLNLVIVLDISGSMSSIMPKGCEGDKNGQICSNLYVAKQAIIASLQHLNNDDRVGIVTFDHDSYVINELTMVQELDMDRLSTKIRTIEYGGSTNFEAGYKEGTKLFENIVLNNSTYENRIIMLTDAMPNTGETGKDYLLHLTKTNAEKEKNEEKIYTTFVGIGIKFNSDLIEIISKIRGSNYYSINSYKEAMRRIDDEFEYMVSPYLFDMSLVLESTQNMYTIDKVYGSPDQDVNKSRRQVMQVATLFPSPPNDDGEIKGGIILIKLKLNKRSNSNNNMAISKLKLIVRYEDDVGKRYENFVSVIFAPIMAENKFDNNGIRKAILLSQYVTLLKEWIEYERKDDIMDDWNHHRGNTLNNINERFKQKFVNFLAYFEMEMKEIGDDTLQKEVDILQKLAMDKATKTEL